jgi:hypothetical protein
MQVLILHLNQNKEHKMAQLPSAFNPNAPGQTGITDFEAVPSDWYVAQIINSIMKPNKAGTGQFLELTWQILQGEFTGRQVWQRLNLVNPSEQAVDIAQKYLKSICDAVGIPGPVSDSQILHGRPCQIRAIKTPATAQYPEGNEVKGYRYVDGTPLGKSGGIAAAVAAPGGPAAAAIAAAGGGQPAAPTPAPAPAAAPAAPPAAPPAAEPEQTEGQQELRKPPWIK